MATAGALGRARSRARHARWAPDRARGGGPWHGVGAELRPMDAEHRLAVAKAYVHASNAHDLVAILNLMAEDVAYRSTGVGAHDGVPAVRTM